MRHCVKDIHDVELIYCDSFYEIDKDTWSCPPVMHQLILCWILEESDANPLGVFPYTIKEISDELVIHYEPDVKRVIDDLEKRNYVRKERIKIDNEYVDVLRLLNRDIYGKWKKKW